MDKLVVREEARRRGIDWRREGENMHICTHTLSHRTRLSKREEGREGGRGVYGNFTSNLSASKDGFADSCRILFQREIRQRAVSASHNRSARTEVHGEMLRRQVTETGHRVGRQEKHNTRPDHRNSPARIARNSRNFCVARLCLHILEHIHLCTQEEACQRAGPSPHQR